MPNNKLEQYDPDKAERILASLAAGKSINAIVKDENTDHRTIQRLREEHPLKLEEWRKLAASKTQAAIDGIMDNMLKRIIDPDSMDKERLKDLALSYGILTDKKLILHGEANQITETRTGPDMDAARKAVEAAQKSIQAEAIDV